jgi:hypothetical protein
MPLDEKDRLYYQTLHGFRTSENRAFEQRTQLFLVINGILAAALTYASKTPGLVGIVLPVFGLAVSFIAIVVGLRITISLDVLQTRLREYEGRIWGSGQAPEKGPYTYWDDKRKRTWVWGKRKRKEEEEGKEEGEWVDWGWCVLRWPLQRPTRTLVCVWSVALFILVWAVLLWDGIRAIR